MNVTRFKELANSTNLSKTEKFRIDNLLARCFKYMTRECPATEDNWKKVLHSVKKELARNYKFHRIQTHNMRSSKGYIDYSSQAYNNSSDDL